MKVTFLSDTHCRHNKINLPGGDLLCFCGDFSGSGWDISEAIYFRDWISKQNYKHILICSGNHDRMMEAMPYYQGKDFFEINENIHYLHNESIEIMGLKCYATADQPNFCNWAFNRTSDELDMSYSQIPENLDILITHCPIKNILDKSHIKSYRNPTGEEPLGSEELRLRLEEMSNPPRYHCFGHIHGDGGKMETIGSTTYINASVCNEAYQPINKIITLEIESKQNEVEN